MTDPRSKPVPEGWASDLDRWCSSLRAQGLTEATVYLRRAHLSQLARGLGSTPHLVTADDLLGWLGRRTWTRETRRTHRSSYGSFLRFIGRDDIAEALPKVKTSPPSPQPIPEDKLQLFPGEHGWVGCCLTHPAGARRGWAGKTRRRFLSSGIV
ncbi:MAG: hypothetical protein Q4G35_03170 [Propionibacteriaceae bacterium]|nr:hypothetical protein [Propionibacteriaceae bacterium]